MRWLKSVILVGHTRFVTVVITPGNGDNALLSLDMNHDMKLK